MFDFVFLENLVFWMKHFKFYLFITFNIFCWNWLENIVSSLCYFVSEKFSHFEICNLFFQDKIYQHVYGFSLQAKYVKYGKPAQKITMSVDIQGGKLRIVKPHKDVLDDSNVFSHDKVTLNVYGFSMRIYRTRSRKSPPSLKGPPLIF